nr:DUF2345 domain-containing protein [Erwinia amylovora]
MITAGNHVDIGAMKNVTFSAEQSLGLFAQKAGAKVIANLGECRSACPARHAINERRSAGYGLQQ